MSKHTSLAADLRQRINPAYAAQRGTESYERRECAEVIEELIELNVELLDALVLLLDREWQDDEGAPTLQKARSQARAAIAQIGKCNDQ